MKDLMAKLKLIALNMKWIAKMVAEKLPNSAVSFAVFVVVVFFSFLFFFF